MALCENGYVMLRISLLLLVGALSLEAALANDSTAELTTGGLVFTKNDAIEMRSEDLFISAAEIRVDYRFLNKTDREVTVHVAFPLPEIKVKQDDENISVPTEDPVNFLAFVTRVNGLPVAYRGRAARDRARHRPYAGAA